MRLPYRDTHIPGFLILVLIALSTLLISCGSDQSEHSANGDSDPVASGESLVETVNRGFDEMASEYYKKDARVIWQKPNLVIELMGNLDGKTVADLGAGTGYFAFRIAAEGGNVIAVDVDPRAIEFMEAEKARYSEAVQERFQTRLADNDDPRLREGEVDVVLMVNTYIYINNRVAYMQRLMQGLKPGGKVIIVDFKKEETSIGPDIRDRISIADVQSELIEAGYAIQGSDVDMLKYQYIVVASEL